MPIPVWPTAHRCFQCEYFAGYKQAYRREDDIATVNAGMRVVFQENSNIVKELTLAYGGMAITTVMPTLSMKAAVGRYDLKCTCYLYKVKPIYNHTKNICFEDVFLCPRHSKNGGGALSVTPVRAFVRASVRPSVIKIGVRSITFKRLHRFDSYLACWCIISKHRSSLIWVTTHWFLTELWAFYKNIAQKLVSAQLLLKDCIDSIHIWHVDV